MLRRCWLAQKVDPQAKHGKGSAKWTGKESLWNMCPPDSGIGKRYGKGATVCPPPPPTFFRLSCYLYATWQPATSLCECSNYREIRSASSAIIRGLLHRYAVASSLTVFMVCSWFCLWLSSGNSFPLATNSYNFFFFCS